METKIARTDEGAVETGGCEVSFLSPKRGPFGGQTSKPPQFPHSIPTCSAYFIRLQTLTNDYKRLTTESIETSFFALPIQKQKQHVQPNQS